MQTCLRRLSHIKRFSFRFLLRLDTVFYIQNVTHFSETSVSTRSTRRHIPEDGILYSHHRENLTSFLLFQFSWIPFFMDRKVFTLSKVVQ
jgi:hypothetical protein